MTTERRVNRVTALVSAHRCGAGEEPRYRPNTAEAASRSAAKGVDFIEFDVQFTADGCFVVHHDDAFGGEPISQISCARALVLGAGRLEPILEVIERDARVGAHVDVKFAHTDGSRAERALIELLLRHGIRGERLLLTSLEDDSVLAMRRVLDELGESSARVGLSLGRSTKGMRLAERLYLRLDETLGARQRLRACRADVVVAHRHLARRHLAWLARQMGLPLLVWTLDRPSEISYWTTRAWMVTGNLPDRVLRIRRFQENTRLPWV